MAVLGVYWMVLFYRQSKHLPAIQWCCLQCFLQNQFYKIQIRHLRTRTLRHQCTKITSREWIGFFIVKINIILYFLFLLFIFIFLLLIVSFMLHFDKNEPEIPENKLWKIALITFHFSFLSNYTIVMTFTHKEIAFDRWIPTSSCKKLYLPYIPPLISLSEKNFMCIVHTKFFRSAKNNFRHKINFSDEKMISVNWV